MVLASADVDFECRNCRIGRSLARSMAKHGKAWQSMAKHGTDGHSQAQAQVLSCTFAAKNVKQSIIFIFIDYTPLLKECLKSPTSRGLSHGTLKINVSHVQKPVLKLFSFEVQFLKNQKNILLLDSCLGTLNMDPMFDLCL